MVSAAAVLLGSHARNVAGGQAESLAECLVALRVGVAAEIGDVE